MSRCYNPNVPSYRDYGARGITLCERWHDPQLFIEDIERLIGPRPPGMTLDRTENDGNYEPGNVRWNDRLGQARNSRRYKGVQDGIKPESQRVTGQNRSGTLYASWWRLLQQRPEEVCERWHDWPSFRDDIRSFLGVRPKGARFYRLRQESLYEPGNVAWVTGTEQIKRARTARLAEPYPVEHGMYEHPLYKSWSWQMKEHSGRLHEPWQDVRRFVTDVETELGPKPAGMTFRLVDPDGRYEPGNVCWGKAGRPPRK